MNRKYPTFFLTWFNKFPRVPSPGRCPNKNENEHNLMRVVYLICPWDWHNGMRFAWHHENPNPEYVTGSNLDKVSQIGVTRYLFLESLTLLWIVIMLDFELYWGLQTRLRTIIDVVITRDVWFMILINNHASNWIVIMKCKDSFQSMR